jgi:hypothetical protein
MMIAAAEHDINTTSFPNTTIETIGYGFRHKPVTSHSMEFL